MKNQIKKFYFGDLCYVFNRDNWSKICDEMFEGFETAQIQFDGKSVELAYTQHGDGIYTCGTKSNNFGTYELPVDSGTIGFAALEDLDVSESEIIERKLGAIIEIDLSNGFAHLNVETNNAYDWYKVYHEIQIKQGREILAYVVTAEPEEDEDFDEEDWEDE